MVQLVHEACKPHGRGICFNAIWARAVLSYSETPAIGAKPSALSGSEGPLRRSRNKLSYTRVGSVPDEALVASVECSWSGDDSRIAGVDRLRPVVACGRLTSGWSYALSGASAVRRWTSGSGIGQTAVLWLGRVGLCRSSHGYQACDFDH